MGGQRYAGKADEILALYKQRYPQKSPFLIQAQVFTDEGVGTEVVL